MEGIQTDLEGILFDQFLRLSKRHSAASKLVPDPLRVCGVCTYVYDSTRSKREIEDARTPETNTRSLGAEAYAKKKYTLLTYMIFFILIRLASVLLVVITSVAHHEFLHRHATLENTGPKALFPPIKDREKQR